MNQMQTYSYGKIVMTLGGIVKSDGVRKLLTGLLKAKQRKF